MARTDVSKAAMLPPRRPEPPRAAAPQVVLLLDPATSAATADPLGLLAIAGVRSKAVPAAALAEAALSADIAIIEIDPGILERFAAFEQLVHHEAGRLVVIAAVRDLTVDTTRRVLRVGAADVLPMPFSSAEFHEATDRVRLQKQRPRAVAPVKLGKIVAFFGALGGIGTTAIATQLGILWAASANVCLIDFDVQFGNAALYLDLRPPLTMADLIDADERLDAELLKAVADRHMSGLNVIAGPPQMMPLDALSPEIVRRTLALAAECFDIVLVDLPCAWTNWSMAVLEAADAACLITGLTVPGIHQARRQLEVIEANGMAEHFRVVVNRVVKPTFGQPDLRETETLLGRKIDYVVTNDYPTVSAAVDQGKPFSAVKNKSRVEKDLGTMVAGLRHAFDTAGGAPA